MEKTSIFDQGPLDFEYLGRKTSHEGYGSRWMKGRIENPIEGDCLEMEYIFKWRLFGYRKYME